MSQRTRVVGAKVGHRGGLTGVSVNVGGAVNNAGAGEAAQVAKAHGLAGSTLVTAVAIAGAESQYKDGAHCLDCVPGVKEDSRGLWQINVDAHPQFASADLYNASVNAAAMMVVSNEGTHWTPWSTYTNGAYLAYWPVAAAAVAALEGGGPIAAPSVQGGLGSGVADQVSNAVSDPLAAVAGFLGDLTNPHTWYRVVLVLGGVGLVGMGVVMLDKSAVGGTAAGLAKQAAGTAAGALL